MTLTTEQEKMFLELGRMSKAIKDFDMLRSTPYYYKRDEVSDKKLSKSSRIGLTFGIMENTVNKYYPDEHEAFSEFKSWIQKPIDFELENSIQGVKNFQRRYESTGLAYDHTWLSPQDATITYTKLHEFHIL